MKILDYSFGRINIDGQDYDSDVIIYPDRVSGSWWRKSGHEICVEDVKEVLEFKPDLLIIGTGAYGVLKVPVRFVDALGLEGIKVWSSKTGEAVEQFNSMAGKQTVVAALHLTC